MEMAPLPCHNFQSHTSGRAWWKQCIIAQQLERQGVLQLLLHWSDRLQRHRCQTRSRLESISGTNPIWSVHLLHTPLHRQTLAQGICTIHHAGKAMEQCHRVFCEWIHWSSKEMIKILSGKQSLNEANLHWATQRLSISSLKNAVPTQIQLRPWFRLACLIAGEMKFMAPWFKRWHFRRNKITNERIKPHKNRGIRCQWIWFWLNLSSPWWLFSSELFCWHTGHKSDGLTLGVKEWTGD